MITAIVLAAGLSQRMGQPKMVLSWGDKTVIGQVVETLSAGGIEQIIVVTGGTRAMVEKALQGHCVTFIFNPDFANGEMVKSLQVGLAAVDPGSEAALMVLGDQPQMESSTVQALCEAFLKTGNHLILPSFQMRRGHPWLIERSLWPVIMDLKPQSTLRDFLQGAEKEISYLPVGTPSILNDLDTPEDYRLVKPNS